MVREPAARGIRCGRVKCGVPDIDKRDFALLIDDISHAIGHAIRTQNTISLQG